jgi:putative hydrolase of the HAD superfamily
VTRARVRGLLLDAAGTLIHPQEPVGETYARVADAHGARISPGRIGEAFRRVFAAQAPMLFPAAAAAEVPTLEREWWREVVRKSFLAADSAARPRDFDALFQTLWEGFADPSAWRLAPGAREALLALRSGGVATAVVSNFDSRLPAILEGLGLTPLLDAIVLPIHARACKPDPAIFRAALDVLGCTAGEAACVGDDPEKDLAGARALGMRAIDANELATLADLPARILEERR